MNDVDKKKKNNVFLSLVQEKNDFIGMIAYSLYKQSKAEYISRYVSDHNGKYPEAEILKIFQEGQCSNNNLNMLYEHAASLIQVFMGEYIQRKVQDFTETEIQIYQRLENIRGRETSIEKKEAQMERKEKELKKKENMLKKIEVCPRITQKPVWGFFNGVLQSILGTIIFAILSIILVLYTKNDIISFLHQTF